MRGYGRFDVTVDVTGDVPVEGVCAGGFIDGKQEEKAYGRCCCSAVARLSCRVMSEIAQTAPPALSHPHPRPRLASAPLCCSPS